MDSPEDHMGITKTGKGGPFKVGHEEVKRSFFICFGYGAIAMTMMHVL